MGTDTPIAVLSDRPRLLFDYFQPAVRAGHQPAARRDPRGAGHRRWPSTIGPEGTCSSPGPASCRQIVLPFPSSTTTSWPSSSHINDDGDLPGFAAVRDRRPVPRRTAAGTALARGARASCAARSSEAIADGARILVLSDRDSDAELRADPVAAAHRRGAPPPHPREDRAPRSAWSSRPATPARCTTSRCCSATAPRAVNPYLAFESIEDLIRARRADRRRARPRRSATTSRRSARAC